MNQNSCPDMLSGSTNVVKFCKNSPKAAQQLTQFDLIKAIYDSGLLAKNDLSGSAKLVLFALGQHYNPQKEDMFPSQKYLSQKLGISERSAERAVAELKSANLIQYETKRVNRYKFTEKFFEAVKMSGHSRQNVAPKPRQNVGQTNNHEQKNNSFKKDFSFNSTQPKGIDYPKAAPIEHKRDERTPENDLETAQKFIAQLWQMRTNYLVKAKIERVLDIWGNKALLGVEL